MNYMKYLSAGMTIALAMYISVMIGGGMLYIDDKARGVHEGYLVTPITQAGTGVGAEHCRRHQGGAERTSRLTVIGSLMAGLGIIFHPMSDAADAVPDRGTAPLPSTA